MRRADDAQRLLLQVRELRRHQRLQLERLIAAARAQARQSGAPIRAAALLHIARFLTVSSRKRCDARVQHVLHVLIQYGHWHEAVSYHETKLKRRAAGHACQRTHRSRSPVHFGPALLDVRDPAFAQRLDPALADSFIQEHEQQLRAAAGRYPFGMESVMPQATSRCAPGQSGGHMMAGAPSDFPFVRAPLYAERDGRFDSAFEKARECFARDSEPDSSSRAVKECWLSTYAFRQVLYKAGRNLGEKAVDSLDPQSSGTRREYYVHAVSSATTVEPELGEVVKDTGS